VNSAEWAASCGGDDSASYRDIMLKGLERCYEHDDRMGDEVLARACFARSQAEGLL